jgi:cytidylate kinase
MSNQLPKIIIAIDGHSACGKSTLAKDLAAHLNYVYVDSGAMYRAVTFYLLENNLAFKEGSELENALNQINIHQTVTPDGIQTTWLNDEIVEEAIRSMNVSSRVSEVAALSSVRHKLVEEQRKMGINKGIVMDGRDIGTVVFPEAELKIFLTAAENVRVERRLLELMDKGINATYDEIKSNLRQRDHIDSTRKDSPLTKAADARLLDNSDLSREGQLKIVLYWVQELRKEVEHL